MLWTAEIKRLLEGGVIIPIGEMTVEAETVAEAQVKLFAKEKELPVDQFLSIGITAKVCPLKSE